jgi:hypothetical protein
MACGGPEHEHLDVLDDVAESVLDPCRDERD